MVRIRSVPSFSFFPHSSLNSYIKILFLPCFIVTSVGKEPFYQKINNNYENYWDIFSLRSTGYNWNKIFSSSESVFIFSFHCLFSFIKDKIIFCSSRGALRKGPIFKAISQNMKGISAFRFFGYKSLPAVPLNSS